jgi:hypothetical protein
MPSMNNNNASFKASTQSENSSTITTSSDVVSNNQLNQNATENLNKHDSLITTTKQQQQHQQNSQASVLSTQNNSNTNDDIYNLPSFDDALNVVATTASVSTVHSLTTSINVNIFIYLILFPLFCDFCNILRFLLAIVTQIHSHFQLVVV